MLYNNIDFILK